MTASEIIETFGEPVFTYSRQDAIDDGVLVDVTDRAKLAGIKVHTAMTSTMYGELVCGCNCVEPIDFALKTIRQLVPFYANEDRIDFKALTNDEKIIDCYVSIHGGDRGEPCMTIMLRGED
jgi:hypothetical protein